MTFRMAVALAMLTASSAAAQRVSFPTFTGPSAAGVRNQLVGAVCDTADCIAATKTTTNSKPDWKKAKKEAVAFFVAGNVVKRGKALSLELSVLNKAGPPKARKSFPLEKSGTLSPKNLQAAMDLLSGAFGGRGAPEKSEPSTPPVEASRPPPPPPSSGKGPTRPSDPPPPPAETKRVREEPDEARGTPPPGPEMEAWKPKFLVLDVAGELLTRKLEYSQVATANLRRYDLPLFAQPMVGVQFYPLALVRDDLLAGLGVEVNVAFAPWLQSRLASVTDSFPTSTVRFDGGVRWNITPVKSYPFTITPYVGVRSQSFVVSPLSDGRRIDGLPNISLVGLRVGLGLDVPIVPRWVNLFGQFGIVPVFGAGELLSSAYFPNGSAFGLEGNGGVSVNFTSFLQLRASFEVASYGFTFSTQPTDTYVAAGASDLYLGGRAGLRFSF